MLGIALDALVLFFVLAFMNKGEAESMGRILLGVVIMTLINLGLGLAGGALGLGPLTLAAVFVLDALFCRNWFGLTWPRALIAVAILLTAKIALLLLMRS